ncbi:MAG: hypothetical protein OHK0019_00290 [Saprospiraceae bacterium]
MAAFNVSLPKLQVSIEEAWNEAIQRGDYMAKTAALRGQLTRQTARVAPIRGTGANAKKLTTTIYWPEICTNTVSDCSDECAVSSSEATDNQKDIALSLCKSVDFKESFKRFRVSPLDFEQVIATQFLVKMKALDEALNTAYISFVEASKGTHEYTAIPDGNVVSSDYEIPSTSWNVDLIPHMMLSAEFSRFSNPFVLDGLNFWTQSVRASANQPNGEGKGDFNLFSEFPFVFDPINMNATAPDKTYLIDGAAIALVTGNFWDTTPISPVASHRLWKQPSRNLPGVQYDVHEITTCTSDDFVVSYRISANYGFFLNPLGCETGRKGVLAFEKVAGV